MRLVTMATRPPGAMLLGLYLDMVSGKITAKLPVPISIIQPLVGCNLLRPAHRSESPLEA